MVQVLKNGFKIILLVNLEPSRLTSKIIRILSSAWLAKIYEGREYMTSLGRLRRIP